MKKILFALFLATQTLALSYAVIGDTAPVLTSEQGDSETDSDQSICYDLKKNMGPVNRGTYRNADKYTDGEVTKLQQFLHDEDYLTPEPTGYFGAKTKAAVIRYQTHKGFDIISGYVGPTTRAAIKADSCTDGADTEDDVVSTSSTATPDVVKGTVLKYDGTPAYATVRCGASGGEYISYPVSTVDGKVSLSSHECKNKGQDVWVVCYGGRSPTLGKTTLAGFNNNTVKCLLPGEGSDVTEINPTNVSSTRLTINNCSIQVNQKTCVSGGSYANYSSNLHWLKLVNRKTGVTTLSVAQPGNHSGTISLAAGEATTLSYGSNALDFADYSTGEVVTSTTATASCVSGTQWNGTVCTPSSVTGNGPTFNFTTANYTVPTGSQIRLNWYQIVGATSCIASGGWSGSKDISNSDNGSSELVTVSAPTTYTLTCTNGNGASTVKSITINIQSATATAGTPELILKINNSKGPIDAVVNRFGGSGTTVLNADWTSNVDVSNCSLGAGFTQYQTAPTLTQTTSRSGTITGSLAQRNWVSTSPQNFDYTMGCKRMSASGYSESLLSNTVRVDTCDVGFHIVRDGSFNGGTCVADTQTTPTCTATLTNGVCVDATASVTPSLTLTPTQYVCAIKLNESTCRIPVKVESTGINSVKYYTSINNITSNQTTATTGNLNVNFDITNGTTNVVFNGYYGSGSSSLQANRVLTAACESGTWNGTICTSGAGSATTPAVPSISASPSSISTSQPMTLMVTDNTNLANSNTSYEIRVTGTTGPTLYTTGASKGLTVYPSTTVLPLTAGNTYTFQIRACIASVCSAWSGNSESVTISSSVTSKPIPTLSLTAAGQNVVSGSNISVGVDRKKSFTWSSSDPTASCVLNGLAVPYQGTVESFDLTSGNHYFTCTNSAGTGSLQFNIAVTSLTVTPITLSLSANGIAVGEGATVTAPNGVATFTWSNTGATSCLLNGVTIPMSGTVTQYSLSPGTHYYTCSNSTGSKTMTFTINTTTAVAKAVTMTMSPKYVRKGVPTSVDFAYSANFQVSSCEVKLNGVVVSAAMAEQSHAWHWDHAQQNSHSVTVTCRDVSGNAAPTASATLTACNGYVNAGDSGCDSAGSAAFASRETSPTIASIGDSLRNTISNINKTIAGQGVVVANVLSGAPAASASSDTCTNITSNLHRGYETASVSKLQNFLIKKGLLSEKASGFFGDLTIEAVKAYQRSVGLPQTGMVYDATREAIMSESCQ